MVNFHFLSLKISQNPVQKASLGSKINSESSIIVKKKKKNQFRKPPNLAPICSTSPYFWPFKLFTHILKPKLSTPSWGHSHWELNDYGYNFACALYIRVPLISALSHFIFKIVYLRPGRVSCSIYAV